MSRGTGSPENRTYITHLKVTDVPWHRLTTAYGRGTDFPEHFTVLEQMRDLASVKKSLYELTANMEHQSTLWHATPFGMVFLSRILEKALQESGQNPVAHFLVGELLDFFACILQCFRDGDEMEHAEPLPLFSDLLKEEYLWSEEYDEAVLEQMRDLASVKKSLYELTANMEHQSTLWHATPFGMVFLSRILEKALQESGQNPVAHFLVGELLDFFACILQCFRDGDEMEHAEPLPLFSDLLKEEYLWSEEYDEEEDEMRYEEDEVFPDDLFYSFYYDSWQAVKAYQNVLEQVPAEFAKPAAAVLELL